MPRDAVPIAAPPASVRRVNPRASLIWIRIDGRWYAGHVQRWYRLEDGGWGLWGCYQADPEHPTVAPRWGNWRYDPAAFADRERHPEPPEDFSPAGPPGSPPRRPPAGPDQTGPAGRGGS